MASCAIAVPEGFQAGKRAGELVGFIFGNVVNALDPVVDFENDPADSPHEIVRE